MQPSWYLMRTWECIFYNTECSAKVSYFVTITVLTAHSTNALKISNPLIQQRIYMCVCIFKQRKSIPYMGFYMSRTTTEVSEISSHLLAIEYLMLLEWQIARHAGFFLKSEVISMHRKYLDHFFSEMSSLAFIRAPETNKLSKKPHLILPLQSRGSCPIK